MAFRKTSTCDLIPEEPEPLSIPSHHRRFSTQLPLRTGREKGLIRLSFSGSESPSPFPAGDNKGRQVEGERIRQMAKILIGPDVAEKQLSNEISAPYEVPQYPIEQIETKLIR